jgi:hypothetical protein
MRVLLIAVLLTTTTLQRPASVAAELLARSLPPPADAADLDRAITSHAVLDDAQGFVIAYYAVEPDGMLHELRIRSFDRATRVWRKWTRAEPIGGVVGLQRGGRYLFVTGHSSPSAAPLLVLTQSLDFKRELDGWPKLLLPDGRVFFERSMVHFAPVHAAALALYDPSTDRETAVYPDATVRNERGSERIPGSDVWMDRSIGEVKRGEPGTITLAVVEQRMRLDRQQRAAPEGPQQRFVVVCTITPSPECRKQR